MPVMQKNLRLTKKAFILLDVRLTFVTFGFAEDTPTQQ